MSQLPPPTVQIDFSSTDFGLKARVRGTSTGVESTIAYWTAIAEQVRLQRPRGVLVIDDMDGVQPAPEQLLDFVHAIRGLGLEQTRVAYVEKHPEQIARTELAGILAAENGFRGQIFDDERSAIMWLRYGGA